MRLLSANKAQVGCRRQTPIGGRRHDAVTADNGEFRREVLRSRMIVLLTKYNVAHERADQSGTAADEAVPARDRAR